MTKDKEKRMTPEIRFKGFSDEWEQRKLSSMTDYKNGKGHEDKQSTSGKLELINLNSISISGGLKHSGKFIDEADDTLQKDDLVMILSDVGHGNLLGRVALIPEDDRFVLNQRVALLRPNPTADPQFLFSYINAHQYYFKAQGAGMSQLNISKGSVEKFISNVPQLSEQNKIGSFFKQIDNTITLYQQKYELLLKLKRAYLQLIFPKTGESTPRVRFADFHDSWEQHMLGEKVKFYSGLTYSPDNIDDRGTLVLRSSNIQNSEIVDADNVYVNPEIVNSSNVHVGDVIVVVRNGSRSLIGKHAVVKKEMDNTVIGAFMTGIQSDETGFTNVLLDTQQFNVEIHKNLGATINQITTGEFKKMKFYFPDKAEQITIGSFFKSINDYITFHQQKIASLKSLKQAYLQKMFV